MAEIQDFDPIDANNVGRWPEGMLGGQINNAGRADEGILGRWYRDTNGSRVSSNVGNAFSITSVRTISSLIDNLIMVFTANITNSGPSTLNLNGLGAKPIKRFNLTELAAGDIISNTPIAVLYKQAHDAWFMTNAPAALVTNMFGDFSEIASPGNPAADVARLSAFDDSGVTMMRYGDSGGTFRELLGRATQAQMEAATDTRQGVSPGRQHFHPGHPKAWGVWNGSALAAGSYGITSIVENSTGQWTVTLINALSNMGVLATSNGSPSFAASMHASPASSTTITVHLRNATTGAFTGGVFTVVVFGDQ